MKNTFLLLSVAAFLFACKNEKPSEKTPEEPTVTIQAISDFELLCEEMAELSPATSSSQYLLWFKSNELESPILIDTLLGCYKLTLDDFETYAITENPSEAINGYYAGGGPIYYALSEESGSIIIKQTYLDEMIDEPLEYSPVKKISKYSDGEIKIEDF